MGSLYSTHSREKVRFFTVSISRTDRDCKSGEAIRANRVAPPRSGHIEFGVPSKSLPFLFPSRPLTPSNHFRLQSITAFPVHNEFIRLSAASSLQATIPTRYAAEPFSCRTHKPPRFQPIPRHPPIHGNQTATSQPGLQTSRVGVMNQTESGPVGTVKGIAPKSSPFGLCFVALMSYHGSSF